jgi:hypothetical protein
LRLTQSFLRLKNITMTTSMVITPEELLKRYAESNRKDPRAAINMVMWLMIYDAKPSSWARDFLEDAGLLTKPEGKNALASQIQKVRRWRNAAEKTVRLPPRGKRGTTSDYKQALQEWKRINPRPTDDELLAGWTPQSLAPEVKGQGEDSAATPVKTTPRKTSEVAASHKPLTGSAVPKNPKEPQSEEPNELLAAVDAELRQAGIPYD